MAKKKPTYRVVTLTSTRASLDPTSPDYERWIDFVSGQKVRSWPKHTPVEEWTDAGRWEAVNG